MRYLMLPLALITALAGHARDRDFLIQNARIHTMQQDGVLQNADVLVRDGRIAAVGRNLDAGGADVINANGKALTPGLFAGITQLGLAEVSLEQATVDNALASNRMYPEFDVAVAFNPLSSLIEINRAEGLSWTLLGPGTAAAENQPGMGALIAGQGAAASLAGSLQQLPLAGARVLFVALGAGASELTGNSRAAQFMLLEQAIAEAKERPRDLPAEQRLLTPRGREVLAGYINGGRWIMQADRAADMLQILDLARRHDLDIIIHGGAEAWRIADRLAASGVPVILDTLQNLPNSFDQLGARLDNAALLHRAGVEIAFSVAGMGSHNARKIRQLAGNAVAHGLPRDEALRAITRNPAEMLGVTGSHGTIAAGMPADLVLWHGDPLEVTGYAERVWIGGREFDRPNRQQLLLQRYLPQDPERRRQYLP